MFSLPSRPSIDKLERLTANVSDALDASDAGLLAGLRAGSPAAFESLLARHGGRLLAAARRLCRNEEDARGAVQDGLLSTCKALGQFDGVSPISRRRTARRCASTWSPPTTPATVPP